ncbi:tryptophan synthase subunit alpha [Marinilabiliaceae bacterium ANBcel2]|nr:tryptophan synthase subunit alpha [Marinilabiliaceae bacterium ANBcel2]
MRLTNIFNNKSDLLSVYFTAGFPELNSTISVLEALENAGVDFVEVGMPFSDPVADGPTIQGSSTHALNNGISLKLLFEQLEEAKKRVSFPLILMGYFNPILKFGVERFVERCVECDIQGVILPDMPYEIYDEKYRHIFEKRGVFPIFLITPQTTDERIKLLDENSSLFLYMVSSSSVTGKSSGNNMQQLAYFKRVAEMKLKSPVMTGFGISDNKSFKRVCGYTNGAIIGSAYVSAIKNSVDIESDTLSFVKRIRG